LSPLLLISLYNLSIAWSLLQYVLPATHWRCDCPCMNLPHSAVHTPAWVVNPTGWIARTNVHAKSSSSRLSSSTASSSSSSTKLSTSTRVISSEGDGGLFQSQLCMLTCDSAPKRDVHDIPTHNSVRSCDQQISAFVERAHLNTDIFEYSSD
jgi:hypothetical protein